MRNNWSNWGFTALLVHFAWIYLLFFWSCPDHSIVQPTREKRYEMVFRVSTLKEDGAMKRESEESVWKDQVGRCMMMWMRVPMGKK
jgi:hypothetical protein